MRALLLKWVATVSSIKIQDLPTWVQGQFIQNTLKRTRSFVEMTKSMNYEKVPPNVTKLEPKYYLMQYQEDLLLPCTVTGNPKPNVIWMKNDQEVRSEWTEVLPNGSLLLKSQSEYYTTPKGLKVNLKILLQKLWPAKNLG